MKKLKKALVALVMMLSMMFFTACGVGGNEDFEYMQQRNIMQVTIQSTRDKKYKFSVTDKDLINDIYTILSSATEVETKSELEPDYILEIYESPTEVKSFNYVAGLDKTDGANLYDGDSYYIVSKRLDTDIIRNFTNIRKPIDFESIYYNSIIECLDEFKANTKTKGKIGIDIINDSEMSRFQISTDLEEFKKILSKDNISYINSEEENSNVEIVTTVKTKGFTSKKYKAIVTFDNKAEGTSVDYYINCIYSDGQWTMNATETKPEDF